MRILRNGLIAAAALIAASGLAHGQAVPANQMPSAGMCRVWVDGLPAARQPGQTDCATARANAPANARILYGAQPTAVRTGVRRDTRVTTRDEPWITGRTTSQSRCRDADRNGVCDNRQAGRIDDGRWDDKSDKERRKYEKKRQKERDKEQRKADKKRHDRDHRNGDHDDDDDDDDDDDRDKDRDKDRDRDRDRDRDGRSDRGTIWGRGDSSRRCTDIDRNGVCDDIQTNRRTRFP